MGGMSESWGGSLSWLNACNYASLTDKCIAAQLHIQAHMYVHTYVHIYIEWQINGYVGIHTFIVNAVASASFST